MKRLVIASVVGWVVLGGMAQPTAYAGVLDWPILSQGNAVVKCIATDAGAIVTSLVTHLSAFAVETFDIVGKCLIYTTAKVTPLPDIPE